MRALLIIPPYVIDEDGQAVLPAKAMLPVGPLMIARLLQDLGCVVEVVDLVFAASWQETLSRCEKPDLLLVSCHTIRNVRSVGLVLGHLAGLWTGLPYTVLGGNACLQLGVKDFARLDVEVDAVVRGFGHDLVPDILGKKTGDLRAAKVTGNLPPPALELLDDEIHLKYLEHSERRYPIVGNGIGCLFGCHYCTSVMGLERSWIERPEHLAHDEIRSASRYGYVHLWDVDNLILVSPERTAEFNLLAASNGMAWSGMTRPELILKHQSRLNKLYLLNSVALGVESANAQILDQLGRQLRAETKAAFHVLEEKRPFSVERVAFVMLDLPGSVEADFWDLVKLLEEARVTTVSWSFYNPPAQQGLFADGKKPEDFGFYRWPLGYSHVTPERVVQQAMWLSARWWQGWHPETTNPHFANGTSFGVRCKEGTIFQDRADRSPSGDVWEVWQECQGG